MLWYCDVCAAEFAPIVDDMLALEFDEPHKSWMRTVQGCWRKPKGPKKKPEEKYLSWDPEKLGKHLEKKTRKKT